MFANGGNKLGTQKYPASGFKYSHIITMVVYGLLDVKEMTVKACKAKQSLY